MLTTFISNQESLKFLNGLLNVFPLENTNIIVDTSDVYDFYGLKIHPTLAFTLSLLENHLDVENWQIVDESYGIINRLSEIDPKYHLTLERIGDREIAFHLFLNHALRKGASLHLILEQLLDFIGLEVKNIFSISDDPIVPTIRTTNRTLTYHEFIQFDKTSEFQELVFDNFEDVTCVLLLRK